MIKIAKEKEKRDPPKDPPEDDTEENEDEESTTSPIIEEANKAAARMEAANKQHEKLIIRQEKLQVEKTLGGHTDTEPVKQKDTDSDYADKVLKGDV